MVHFSGRNLIDNIFLLATTVLAFAAWVIAFAGLCALRATGAYWWIMIFELALVVGVILLILTGSFVQYRLVVLTFLAVSISYITGQLSIAISLATDGHSSNSVQAAGSAFAAGYIVLIIIQIAWVFVFGSEPHSYVGKFAQHNRNSIQQHPHHTGGSAAAVGAAGGLAAGAAAPSSPNNNTANETIQDKTAYENSPTMTHPSMATSPVLEYNERVEALHEYRANPEDPSELSFDRGDILEIVDRRGNWWQARKQDGSTGIIPSNYFA